MLNVIYDELVVEEKGIYSIESFISARRIMYWQVYLHKTAVSAEKMLIELIKRVKICKRSGMNLISTPALSLFLNTKISKEDFETNPNVLQTYMELDDTDIWGSIKFWIKSEDPIIHLLSNALLNRDLFKIQFLNTPEKQTNILKIKKIVSKKYDIPQKLTSSLVILGRISNAAYTPKNQIIKILRKNGKVEDISAAVDLPNIKAMSKIVEKNYLCYPKNVSLEDYSSLK